VKKIKSHGLRTCPLAVANAQDDRVIVELETA